jgi:hypothetical protein
VSVVFSEGVLSPSAPVGSDLGANFEFATGTPISVGIMPTTTNTYSSAADSKPTVGAQRHVMKSESSFVRAFIAPPDSAE